MGDPSPIERDRREQERSVPAKTTPRIAMAILALLSAGCATLSGSREQYYVCSYDIVWDASLETMKGQSVADLR